LENDIFCLRITDGRITSLVDKRLDRELILAGPGAPDGGLIIYEDYPLRYDAWDAEIYHLDTYTLLSFDEVTVENTPLRSSLVATARFGKSVAKLTVRLATRCLRKSRG
jgi:alpha-mannosidase